MKRALLLVCCLVVGTLAFSQDLPIDVKGDGIKIVAVADKFPFEVSIKDDPDLIGVFWGYPTNVAAESDFGPVLKITAAPKGEIKFTARALFWNETTKKRTIKVGSKIINVGAITPPPPQPDPPGPGPQPDPPGPTPGIMASFIVGVTNNAERTQGQVDTLLSKSLYDWFQANKIKWRVYDDDETTEFKVLGLDKVLADQKVTAPAIIGWFDGKPKAVNWLQNVEDVKKFASGKMQQVMFRGGPGEFDYILDRGEKRWLTRLPPDEAAKLRFAKLAPKFADAVGAIPRSLWKTINRRSVFGPQFILDQNGHGSCVGHGAVGALREMRFGAGMTDIHLSANCVYGQINGGRDQGAMVGDSLDALKKVGTTKFDTIGTRIYLSQFPAGWKEEAKRFKIEAAYFTPTTDEIGSAIQLGYTVVMNLEAGGNFGSLDKYGVAGYSSGYGNHCLFLDGYQKLPDGRDAYDCVNSWGTGWGQSGRCFIVDRHLSTDQSDTYAIKTATEDPQETIKPPVYRVTSLLQFPGGPEEFVPIPSVPIPFVPIPTVGELEDLKMKRGVGAQVPAKYSPQNEPRRDPTTGSIIKKKAA